MQYALLSLTEDSDPGLAYMYENTMITLTILKNDYDTDRRWVIAQQIFVDHGKYSHINSRNIRELSDQNQAPPLYDGPGSPRVTEEAKQDSLSELN